MTVKEKNSSFIATLWHSHAKSLFYPPCRTQFLGKASIIYVLDARQKKRISLIYGQSHSHSPPFPPYPSSLPQLHIISISEQLSFFHSNIRPFPLAPFWQCRKISKGKKKKTLDDICSFSSWAQTLSSSWPWTLNSTQLFDYFFFFSLKSNRDIVVTARLRFPFKQRYNDRIRNLKNRWDKR